MATSSSSIEFVVESLDEAVSLLRREGASRRVIGCYIAIQSDFRLKEAKIIDGKLILPSTGSCFMLSDFDMQGLKSPILRHLFGASEDWYGSIEEVRQAGNGVAFKPLSGVPADLDFPAINGILKQLEQLTGDSCFGMKTLSAESPAKDFGVQRRNVDLLCANTIFAGIPAGSAVALVDPDPSVILLPASTKFQKKSILNADFLLSQHPHGSASGKYTFVDNVSDLRKLKGLNPEADWCCEVDTGFFEYSKYYALEGGFCFCHAFAGPKDTASVGSRYGVYALAHDFYHAARMVAGTGLYLDPDFRKQVKISKVHGEQRLPAVAVKSVPPIQDEKQDIADETSEFLTDDAFALAISSKVSLSDVAITLGLTRDEKREIDAFLGKAYGNKFFMLVDGFPVGEAVKRVVGSMPVAKYQTRRVARILFGRYSGQLRYENGIVKKFGTF